MWDPIWDGKNRVWRLYLAVVENNSKSARKRALLLEVTRPLRLHAGSLKTAGPCLVLIACVLKENKLGKYVSIGVPDEK